MTTPTLAQEIARLERFITTIDQKSTIHLREARDRAREMPLGHPQFKAGFHEDCTMRADALKALGWLRVRNGR